MAESVPSSSTFDALTEDYTPRSLIDNIFIGTPVWEYFRRNMMAVSGRAWTPIIEIATEDGEWYDAGDQLGTPTTKTGEIATRATFPLHYYRRKVLLNAQDTDLQGSLAIVDVLKAQVKNATNAMRKNLSAKLFTGNAGANPTEMQGLAYACDNVAATTYGGLTGTAYPTWEAHVMEGASDGVTNFGKEVSPSVENLALLIDTIIDGTGEAPDLITVLPAYWHILYGQFTRDEYASLRAANASNNTVKWGFSSLFIRDVPIVRDRDMTGAAFTAAQATRANAAGYQAMALNFGHLKLAYNAKRAFKWDPAGWQRPTDYDQYLNKLYFWGSTGTDSRRVLGRVFNVNIAESPDDWSAGEVDLPA